MSTAVYSHFRHTRSYGFGFLGVITSGMLILACIVTLLLNFFVSWQSALIWALTSALAIALVSIKDRHKRSWMDRLVARFAFTRAHLAKETEYRSGPMTYFGTNLLPGLHALTNVTEWKDASGSTYALLRYPKQNQYVVVFSCNPDGSGLQDPADIDANTERWGEWLGPVLANEPNFLQAQVTIQTTPGSGSELKRELDLHQRPDAPELAKVVLDKIRNTYHQGTSDVTAWVALTFSGYSRTGKRSSEAMAKALATRLPSIRTRLANTGAGVATPLDANTLAQDIRMAYDPASIRTYSEMDAQGIPRSQSVTLWSGAGPMAYSEHWDHLVHDSGVSVTWMKTGVRGEVRSNVLVPLLESHPDIDVKRVSMIYKPLPPERGAVVAEVDKRNARHRVNQSANPSERALVDHEAASVTAKHEAGGAALVDFATWITATVLKPGKRADAMAAVDSLAPTARLQHLVAYGSQAAAFAQNLPLGVIATEHVSTPTAIREGL